MKLVLITDLHFGARNSSNEIDSYYEKFYTNIFFPYLKENKLQDLIILGDTFDNRKQINISTLESCKRYFFDQLLKNDIKVNMIVGNHDSFFKNTIKTNSPRELLSESYSNITIVDDPFELGNILMLPWICDDNEEESFSLLKSTKCNIVMGHFEIAGFSMYKGQINEHGLSRTIFDRFDKVFSGHYHHRSTIGNITYLGNPFELTWSDYDDPRGFHVFDTETLELEFIKNPYTMFEKIQYDEDSLDMELSKYKDKYIKLYIRNRKDYNKFDHYIKTLMEHSPIDVKIIDEPLLDNTCIDEDQTVSIEDTFVMISQYVDSMESELDKDRLKDMMKSLYTESMEMQ